MLCVLCENSFVNTFLKEKKSVHLEATFVKELKKGIGLSVSQADFKLWIFKKC